MIKLYNHRKNKSNPYGYRSIKDLINGNYKYDNISKKSFINENIIK